MSADTGADSYVYSIFTGRFVTTDLVLVELANSLSLPPNRAVVISAIERIRTDEMRKKRLTGNKNFIWHVLSILMPTFF